MIARKDCDQRLRADWMKTCTEAFDWQVYNVGKTLQQLQVGKECKTATQI
jgi:hypothetical protein